MPRTGDGPFQRGERLTATRLNDLAKGVPVFMTGGTITESPTGKLINVDQPENIYIRLTGKTGTSPIKYAWKEVVRLANGTWMDTPRTANYTDDYAIELNNSNLSTTDNYVYRAERSPHSGEWLFFLRRSRTTISPIRVIPVLQTSTGSNCTPAALVLGFSATSALGSSVPSAYRVANVTLRYQDNLGSWTTLKTWTEASDSTWGNFTFTPPYTPSSSQPLTLELTGQTANGTLLGQLGLTCVSSQLCGTAITTDLLDSAGTPLSYFYGPVSANLTACTTNLTSATTNITMVLRPTVTGSLSLPSGSINGPNTYNFKMSWTSDTGSNTDILSFINANYSGSFSPGSPADGGSATSSLTESHGFINLTRYGQATAQIGFTVNENWSTSPPAWPSQSPSYSYGILKESATVRVTKTTSPTKTVEATGCITHYGNAATSFSTINVTVPAANNFTDGNGNTYTLGSGNATPSGSC